MEDAIMNVLLGAIGSIFATIVLYILSLIYRVGYKKDFHFALEMAYSCVYQIENLRTYSNDYPLIIEQVDKLRECAFRMYRLLSPFSLIGRRKERKLIITLLSDIISVCEICKFTTIGYSGESEWEARLEKIQDYFFKYPYLRESNVSTVRVQLNIIQKLIDRTQINSAIKEGFGNLADEIPTDDLVVDCFIHCNSLKQQTKEIGIRNDCFTQKQLEKLLRKKVGK